MSTEKRPLSPWVRIGGVLLALVLFVPVVAGALAVAGGVQGGVIAGLGFVLFFGGIIALLAVIRRRNDAQRAHDRQWGPRPRPPG